MNLQGVAAARPTYRRSGRGLESSIRAEKAATMIRKGAEADEVCKALGIKRATLKQLAHDYDFALPERWMKYWPSKDDPGIAEDRIDYRLENYLKARSFAASQLQAICPAVAANEVSPEQTPAVPFEDPEPEPEPVVLTPGNTSRSVIEFICWKHNLTREDLLSGSRRRHIVLPRQEAMFLIRHNVRVAGRPISMPEIARRLGLGDHTTVLHGIRAHEARMKETA